MSERKTERERDREIKGQREKRKAPLGRDNVNPNCGCLNFQARKTLTPKNLWSQTFVHNDHATQVSDAKKCSFG